MKFLLIGKGKSIKSIIKYLKHKKAEFIHAVYQYEYDGKTLLADESLLTLDDIDFAIKSPGIPENDKIYLKLSQKFRFVSELDLLNIFDEKVKSIVVTGSNGKTTFVSMLHFLFNKMNIKSLICGNSFEPITSYYKYFDKLDYLIIEQSSFQLHNLSFYNPYISLILNLQENHLDNSYSLNSYYENKMKIYKYQNKNSYFIYDDSNEKINVSNINGNVVELLNFPLMDKIKNTHKKYYKNINYIYTIFTILNLDYKKILILNEFNSLKYRENIYKVKDITFINDSKSTSVDSTIYALSHVENLNNTILIIGGKDKNLSLLRLNKYKVKHIICYGQLADKANKQLNNPITCLNLSDAFNVATSIYLKDKIILFSPATSSFDQFVDYKQRGLCFDKMVKKYEKNIKK